MKTGLSKKQKTTSIFFDEDGDMFEICIYNTDLKNRLSEFAALYPKECRTVDNDSQGYMNFEVKKGWFGFRLTAPYTEEGRKAASDLAKKHVKNLRRNDNGNPIL